SRSEAGACATAARNSANAAASSASVAMPSSGQAVPARVASSAAVFAMARYEMLIGGWLLQRRFRLGRKLAEAGGVVHGDVGQDLAVERDAGELQAVHELAVADLVLAGGGADADDPELAELALALLAPAVGELERALAGFLRRAVQLALGEEEALGEAEDFLALVAPFGAAFYARHRFLLFLCTAAGHDEAAAGR